MTPEEKIAQLQLALDAALRAATLALFVIRKQNVMPNHSWEGGFDEDIKKAVEIRDRVKADARPAIP